MNIKPLVYYAALFLTLIGVATGVYWKYQSDRSDNMVLKNDVTVDEPHKKLVFGQDDVTLVTSLKTRDGSILGRVYVTYLTKDVFSALYVVKEIDGKKAIIYKIDRDGFSNTLGKEEDTTKSSNYYGYQFTDIMDDYFIVHMVTDGGRGVSDDATIVWNSKKNVFEIQRPHLEDLEGNPDTVSP